MSNAKVFIGPNGEISYMMVETLNQLYRYVHVRTFVVKLKSGFLNNRISV